MKILLIGQTTLHWGRLEFGNIGNYYVIEPFFEELRKVFPSAQIRTTLQLSRDFCNKFSLYTLPIELYYSFELAAVENLKKSIQEFGIAQIYNKTGYFAEKTPFIEEVYNSDLVIDFSGDVWGDNADFAGEKRFLVGLLKDRVAQLLNKKVVMIAGSPGPFDNNLKYLNLTKEVFENFTLVTNRESESEKVLQSYSFNTENVKNFACPAFLFKSKETNAVSNIIQGTIKRNQAVVGLAICGWNMEQGPFSKWPREDNEYYNFVQLVEFLASHYDLQIALFSHSNGFEYQPQFKLIHGRDYPIAEQLYRILIERKKITNHQLKILTGIYSPKETKAIIAQFDMLISGRVHGSVAGLSQFIPTVMIDYGHEPKAHKVKGFAKIVGVEQYLANPNDFNDLKEKSITCWENRKAYSKHLKMRIPQVQELARKNFSTLSNI